MDIKYDKSVRAMYIHINDCEILHQKRIDDNIIIDLDANSNIVGIELLSPWEIFSDNALADLSIITRFVELIERGCNGTYRTRL